MLPGVLASGATPGWRLGRSLGRHFGFGFLLRNASFRRANPGFLSRHLFGHTLFFGQPPGLGLGLQPRLVTGFSVCFEPRAFLRQEAGFFLRFLTLSRFGFCLRTGGL